MKGDQMGTDPPNPSPRELPLSNQTRFSLAADLVGRDLGHARAGAMRPSCRCVVPMHIALGRVSRDALTFGHTGILLTEFGWDGRLTTALAGTLRASLQRGRTW